MREENNIKNIRNLFEEVFSGCDPNAMDKYFAENVKLNDPATPKFKGGLEDLKKLEAQYVQAFPDKKLTINEIVASDQKVVVHWTCSATHKGTVGGYPASGNKIKVTGISIYDCGPDGKITKITQLWDRLALMEQIGQASPLALKS